MTIAADAEGKIVAWDSHHWGSERRRRRYRRHQPVSVRIQLLRIAIGKGPASLSMAARSGLACATPSAVVRTHAHGDRRSCRQAGMDSYDVFLKNLGDKTDRAAGSLRRGNEDRRQAHRLEGEVASARQGSRNGPVKQGLGMALHTWGGAPHNCDLPAQDSSRTAPSSRLPDRRISAPARERSLPSRSPKPSACRCRCREGQHRVEQVSPVRPVGRQHDRRRRLGTEPPRGARLPCGKSSTRSPPSTTCRPTRLSAKDQKIFSNDKEVCTWKQAARWSGRCRWKFRGKGRRTTA